MRKLPDLFHRWHIAVCAAERLLDEGCGTLLCEADCSNNVDHSTNRMWVIRHQREREGGRESLISADGREDPSIRAIMEIHEVFSMHMPTDIRDGNCINATPGSTHIHKLMGTS